MEQRALSALTCRSEVIDQRSDECVEMGGVHDGYRLSQKVHNGTIRQGGSTSPAGQKNLSGDRSRGLQLTVKQWEQRCNRTCVRYYARQSRRARAIPPDIDPGVA